MDVVTNREGVVITQWMVDDALDTAVNQSGYTGLLTEDPDSVATEMGTVNIDFEGMESSDLAPFVKNWQERRAGKNGTQAAH